MRQIDEKTYEFDGKLDLESIEEMLHITFSNTNDHITIGGYVFGLLGRLPIIKDKICDEHFEFEVLEMDGARIKKLKATALPQTQQES